MHIANYLQALLLLVSSTMASLLPLYSSTALSAPASTIPPTIPSSFPSTPISIDKPNLNPRLSWDDIVNGAKSLYSQAMATPTTIEIQGPSSTLSTSSTAAAPENPEEGNKNSGNSDTQFKDGKGWKNGSNILERRGLLAGAGLGLVVLGLYG